MKKIEIYTDGAYSPSRDVGGIGIVFVFENGDIFEYNKQFKHTTNNKCELAAVIGALLAIKNSAKEIIVYSDSQYVICTITKGWKISKNKPLWELFVKAYQQASTYCSNIQFEWVKGHSDNNHNNRADELAVEASQWV